eukprot:1006782-Amphidinium_carterae.1
MLDATGQEKEVSFRHACSAEKSLQKPVMDRPHSEDGDQKRCSNGLSMALSCYAAESLIQLNHGIFVLVFSSMLQGLAPQFGSAKTTDKHIANDIPPEAATGNFDSTQLMNE